MDHPNPQNGEQMPEPTQEQAAVTQPERRIGRRGKIIGAIAGLSALTIGTAVALSEGEEDKIAANNAPQATTTTAPARTEGLNTQQQEMAYHIAGEGSCSPYKNSDIAKVQKKEIKFTEADLIDTEVKFLSQNAAFANNYAKTSENRIGTLFDALNIAKPSANQAKAGENLVNVFKHENYVEAPLAKATRVQNTYCDANGNVIDYRQVDLEKGTHVGGILIESISNDANGRRTATFKVGNTSRTVVLKPTDLVTEIEYKDAQGVMRTASIYATHKVGMDVDSDWVAYPGIKDAQKKDGDFGCMNVITGIETTPATTTTNKATTTTKGAVASTTTRPGATTTTQGPTTTQQGTTTTRGGTTTTRVVTTTTRPSTTTIPPKNPQPPVDGGPATTVEPPKPGPSNPTTSINRAPTTTSPNTVTTSPNTTQAPGTTAPSPSTTRPPVSAPTSVATTIPGGQQPNPNIVP